MKRKRFSVEQIVAVPKQAELGMPVADLIRHVGISEQTFYRWSKQYAGMQSDQVRELKQLQDENARFKKLVAELSLDKAILQDVASKVARPALRKDVVDYVISHYGLTMRRACRLVKYPSSTQYYQSVKDPRHIFVDNGSEFSGRLLDIWAYHHKSKIDFSRPGKPTDNCHIETFNGSFRDECLNLHWFETLDEAKATIEAWRGNYNESGPHSALQELVPAEFARKLVFLPGST